MAHAISGELSFKNAAAALDAARAALNGGQGPFEVDLSGITRAVNLLCWRLLRAPLDRRIARQARRC